ncbi:MAG: hypothetical protein ACNA7I_06785 [Candidatus Methanoperedens sp.]|nr:hypothetical protein [Candidatus Methanoperedens sp.]
MNHNESEQGGLTCGTMSVSSKEQLLDIKDDLELFLKKIARKNNIKVVRGQKGNLPRAYHAVDFLLYVWNFITPERKKEAIARYSALYLQNIMQQGQDKTAVKTPAPLFPQTANALAGGSVDE